MRITIKRYNAVASWRWNLKPSDENAVPGTIDHAMGSAGEQQDAEDNMTESDEEVCGICRVPFEGCCSKCKTPGDDCPLIFGECTHVFHLHCLLTWLQSDSSKNQCPLDRRPWVNAEQALPSEAPQTPANNATTPRR